MPGPTHAFEEDDRVRAISRQDFPLGTVVRLLEGDYVLVHWDGDVLETAHSSELAKVARVPPA